MNSTQRVVENHIQRFREGDLEGVLEDFSPEAVVFTPSGTLKGKSEIKTLFQNLLEEFGKPEHRRRCARQSSRAIMPT